MHITDLGNTRLIAGQLLSFFAEDKEKTEYKTIILYTLKDFNLSEVMVEYYPQIEKDAASFQTAQAMESFAKYLVDNGYATQPESTIVKIGTLGRPAQRLIEEYKFHLNKNEFLLEKINELIRVRCNGFCGHYGNYYNVINPAFSSVEIRMVVELDGEQLGIVPIGVIGQILGGGVPEFDLPYFKHHLQGFLAAEFPGVDLVVSRVYPPTAEALIEEGIAV